MLFRSAADDNGTSPTDDPGVVNIINLIGDTGTGADGTFDLDLGSVDIIGVGTAAQDGNTRNAAGIVLNGGDDNSRDADSTLAGTDNSDDDELRITTTSDDVRFNGHVFLGSDVVIDQDVAGGVGADVLFTNDAFIDSASNGAELPEGNDLEIDAGTQNVFFNDDIGAGTDGQLGQLLITQADASVVFGQADADDDGTMPTNDGGVVNSIVLIGDIGTTAAGDTAAEASEDLDIGRDEIVTSIVLNGGNNNSRDVAGNMADDQLTITTNADDVRFNGALRLDSDVRIDADGTYNGSVTTGTTGTNTVVVDDASGLTVGDRVRIGDATTGELHTVDAIDFGTNTLTLRDNLASTQDGTTLVLAGADLLFTNDTSIDSASGEGNDLELDAGTQSVFFNEDIGAAGADTELGRLLVEEADGLDDSGTSSGGVIFGQAAADDNGTSPTDDGGVVNTVNIIGDTGAGSDATFDIDLGSVDTIGVGFGTGNDRNGAGIVLNGGDNNSTAFNAVFGAGEDTITFQSTSDDLRFNGHVVLGSDAIIDTDAADANGATGADILFTNDAYFDSDATEANSALFDAGQASLFFNDDIGAGTDGQLGRLIVSEADTSVVFGQAAADDDGLMPLVDGGVVNTISLVGDDTNAGFEASNDFDIGRDQIVTLIVFNGGNNNSRDVTGNMTDDTLTLLTTSDDVRLNGALRLDSDVRIDTDETGDSTTGGADVLFTNDTSIDSFDSEGNDLELDAGIASVFFNGDIGGGTNGQLGR